MRLLVRGADLGRGAPTDVRVDGDRVAEVGTGLEQASGEDVVHAGGGALLPGLHDHHLHLFSLAASLRSVRCDRLDDVASFHGALRESATAVAPGEWVRAIGYHESIAGPLDRHVLDRVVDDRPVRVQHRGGALWVVNSVGAALLSLDGTQLRDVERDASGAVTGRLWRLDGWLRERIGSSHVDLAAVGRLLGRHGITGVTDATPDLDQPALAELAAATEDGRLPQRAHLLGARPDAVGAGRLSVGPWKILLPDHSLPSLDEVVAQVRAARASRRPVAVHCVTREALVLTLAVLDEVGPVPGDRLEHGSVMPPELVASAARLGLRVVTQPVFLAERGDEYLAEVDPDDVPHLYPYASLLAAGVPVAPSSDAPFGDPDPWGSLVAARDRQAPSGRVVGAAEQVPTATALAGLLSPLEDPGGPVRRIEPGAPADLCLLHEPLAIALAAPSSDLVRLTVCDGRIAHGP